MFPGFADRTRGVGGTAVVATITVAVGTRVSPVRSLLVGNRTLPGAENNINGVK